MTCLLVGKVMVGARRAGGPRSSPPPFGLGNIQPAERSAGSELWRYPSLAAGQWPKTWIRGGARRVAGDLVMMSKFRRAGSSLVLAYAVEHGIVLVRNVLVARLLGPENFGIAATFMLVVGAIGLVTDLGIEKYLLHVREEELPDVQPSLYGVLICRGLLGAVAIALLSYPLALLFGLEGLAYIYLFAALVPLIGAFKNLDPLRRQRQLDYRPGIAIDLSGTVLGSLVAVGVAAATGSYMAVIWGMLVTITVAVVMSHLLAREPYRPGFQRQAARQLLLYGWPLLLNGLLIFVSGQGDRFLIGILEGMTDLAGYVAAGTLTIGASLVLTKLTGNIYLPILSAVRDDPESFARRSRICGAISVAIVIVTLVPMLFLTVPLVALLFGPDYRIPVLLAGFLSVQSAARILRSWPVVVALSLGTTQDILSANLVRSLGFPIALWAALSGYGVVGVAASVAAGEVLSTVFALLRADRVAPGRRQAGLRMGLLFCAVFGVALTIQGLAPSQDGWVGLLLMAVVVVATGLLALLAVVPDLRRRLVNGLRLWRAPPFPEEKS